MNAFLLQRRVLLLLVVPLALMSFVWNLIKAISILHPSLGEQLSENGLGPIGLPTLSMMAANGTTGENSTMSENGIGPMIPPDFPTLTATRAQPVAPAILGCIWSGLVVFLPFLLIRLSVAARSELLVLALLSLIGLIPLIYATAKYAHPVILSILLLVFGWSCWGALSGVAFGTYLWIRRHHRAELWTGQRSLDQLANGRKRYDTLRPLGVGYTAAQMQVIPTPVSSLPLETSAARYARY